MSRRWLIQAKDYPDPVTNAWGDTVTIDLRPLLPAAAVSAVRVRKAMIPYIAWNVTDDNNIWRIRVGVEPADTLYTVTLDPGNYSRSSLVKALVDEVNTLLAATNYVFSIAYNSSTFITTISLTDANAIAIPFSIDTTTVANLSPSLLQLLGFAGPIIPSTPSAISSTGALTINDDRFLLITCDEARGSAGVLDSLSPSMWHDGIIAVVPIPTSATVGDVITYTPEDSSPWIGLVRTNTNAAITLRLARSSYSRMGGSQTSWAIELEVRP